MSTTQGAGERYPGHGYPALHGMPRAEGPALKPKRNCRICREEGLQIVDLSISGRRLVRELDQLISGRPLLRTSVCDNGPEFTGKATFFWQSKPQLSCIASRRVSRPGVRSSRASMARCREYCLDLHWFTSLDDAQSTIEARRTQYNRVRPHRSLGKKPPAVFAKEAA